MGTKKWNPKNGQAYYWIKLVGKKHKVCYDVNDMQEYDKRIVGGYNCYKTRAEATKKLKQIKIILKQP